MRVVTPEVYLSLLVSFGFLAFWTFIGMPNSFSKDGLVDGLGSITSILAGFYVAGLVAIATFFREKSSLDDVIEKGPVILNHSKEDEERLTRRQYVCAMFGFLVGLSFFLSIVSVLLRASAENARETVIYYFNGVYVFGYDLIDILEAFVVGFWICIFSLQMMVTFKGLYYLMGRIYDIRPVLGKPSDRDTTE